MTLGFLRFVTNECVMDRDGDIGRGDEEDTSVEESAWDNGICGWEDCFGTGEGEREHPRHAFS